MILPYSVVLASSSNTFQITKCLGQEEELIHKNKVRGEVYHINQTLLSIFLNLPAIKLKSHHHKTICNQIVVGTSLLLLETIFRHYEKAFTYSNSKSENTVDQKDIADLIQKLPELFNQYLTILKTQSPTHDCLEQHVPELKSFYKDVQYLEENMNFKKLAERDNQLIKILDRLKEKDKFFELCRSKGQ